MTRCRICETENMPGVERCANCSAWLEDGSMSVAASGAIGSPAAASQVFAGDPAFEAQMIELVRAGRTIDAIKAYRERTGAGLKEGKDAIEAVIAKLFDKNEKPSPQDGTLESEVLQLLRAGKKIDAIKTHRTNTGLGLKEAKDAVEALGRTIGIEPGKSGCAGMLVFVAFVVSVAAGVLAPMAHGGRAHVVTEADVVIEDRAAEDSAKGSPTRAQKLLAEDRVLVIAHRGDSKAAPENTLPAFRSAVKVGVDFVEFDYYHTADGVPIVIHDATLDRTTDAEQKLGGKKIAVSSKTLAELAPLDAGSWQGKQFAGTKLPTVAETLTTILPGAVPLIERKGGDAKTIVEHLKSTKVAGDCVVQAFDWEFLADCHKLAPEIVLGALGKEELTDEKLDQAGKTGAIFIGWSEKSLTKENIAAAHKRKLKVLAYTVDDPQRAEQLIDAGLDGLISNVPGVMKKVVERTK